MEQAMELWPQQRLEARCSPEQVMFASVLALNTVEFEATVAAAMDENPALKRLEPECVVCGGVVGCPSCRTGSAHSVGRFDPEDNIWEQIAAPVSLAEALLRNITPLLPSRDASIAEYVIASLDEHGLLDMPPEEIATLLGVERSRVDGVLAALRTVTSPGVGASTVGEHLLLELDTLDPGPVTRLARAIVTNHLPSLARGHFRRIAKELGTEPDAVVAARDLIRARLRPHPVVDADRPHTPASRPFAFPDLAMLSNEEGAVTVRVLEADRVRLRLSPLFEGFTRPGGATTTGRAGAALADEDPRRARAWLDDATAFVDRVHGRWATMQAVAEAVAQRQQAFIACPEGNLHPLTRAAVAAELGVHESTVGRTVKHRYLLLSSGRVLPFGDFFPTSPGLGEELRRIVADERRPLSDAELAAELTRRGHRVARRTVAKYRAHLGIVNRALRS